MVEKKSDGLLETYEGELYRRKTGKIACDKERCKKIVRIPIELLDR